jgi:hypothetical protein
MSFTLNISMRKTKKAVAATLALTMAWYSFMFTTFVESPNLIWVENYAMFQPKVGLHNTYNWTNHQSTAHSGDEYEFKTSCPNRTRPPKHVYILRHTERMDFVFAFWAEVPQVQWTQRAFNESGMSGYFLYII